MILTIGHSTHPAETFVALLATHGVDRLADIRRFPSSRRYPHFNREALADLLPRHGIDYEHFGELGGRRTPRRDSRNTALRHPAFRGYADYMDSAGFTGGVERLLAWAEGHRAAVMCAEAVWWQCHRRLLADALVVRGVAVAHILSSAAPKPHELSEFAKAEGLAVTYPGLL